MKKHFPILAFSASLFVAVLYSGPVMGDVDFEVTSSPNVVGSGARALGVGGAFIAIADDATAASWNPAALIVLAKPESAVMFSYEDRERMGTANFSDFNYIAISYPFTFAKYNMIVSFNYQRLLDFNSKFEQSFTDLVEDTRDFDIADPDTYDPLGPHPVFGYDFYEQDGYLIHNNELSLTNKVTGDIGAFAPAFAVQITPKLSVGVTLNFWTNGIINDGYQADYEESREGWFKYEVVNWLDINGDGEVDAREWEDTDGTPGPTVGDEGELAITEFEENPFDSYTTLETRYDNFFGINANLGILWNATRHLTLGAVYKTPFTATVDITQDYYSEHSNAETVVDTFEWRWKVNFPAVYGLGAACRFNDNFTMALDLSYTEWDQFIIKEYLKTDEKASPAGFGTGGDLYVPRRETSAVSGVATQYADIDGVVTARLGAEYLFILPKTIIPVRLGFAYDPEPAQGHPDDFYTATAGTGVVLFKRFIFDVAYQYRWSQSATLATVTDFDGVPLYEQHGAVSQHIVMLSSILHF